MSSKIQEVRKEVLVLGEGVKVIQGEVRKQGNLAQQPTQVKGRVQPTIGGGQQASYRGGRSVPGRGASNTRGRGAFSRPSRGANTPTS